ACPDCGLTRPEPQVAVTELRRGGMAGSDIAIATPEGAFALHLPVPGLYNVYNALAAAAAAHALGAGNAAICGALTRFSAAFGRVERVDAAGRTVWFFLAKNPVGANEVLRTVFEDHRRRDLLLILNDNE